MLENPLFTDIGHPTLLGFFLIILLTLRIGKVKI